MKQISNQARILKTVREENCQFKLEQPVNEIFQRMRGVSLSVIKSLKPHPHYLLVSLKFVGI